MIKTLTLGVLMRSVRLPLAFDGPKVGWKKDVNGVIELDAKGDPIYVHADGKELSMEVAAITRMNGESMQQRRKLEKVEADLKLFEGIDAEKARAALATVEDIDLGKLVKSDKLEEVRAAVSKTFEKQLADSNAALGKVTGDLDNMRLQGAFNGSKFIADKTIVPPDMLQAMFGNRFKYDPATGRMVGKNLNGTDIFSGVNGGQLADVDEALAIIISDYGAKDKILKGNGHTGTGNGGDASGGNVGKRTVSREQFEALDATQRSALAAEITEGKAAVV